MANKILTSKEIIEGKTTIADDTIDEIFEDEKEELPAVGVSTVLKKEEAPPKEEPKNDLENLKSDLEELRNSIHGGMNIHRIWVRLGEILDNIEKMV